MQFSLHPIPLVATVLLGCGGGLFTVEGAFACDLLFSERDLARIRANAAHPVLSEFWEDYRRAESRGAMDFQREALVYLVDGDGERLESAIEGLMEMVRRERWHEFQDADGTAVGFLRCAARTANVALVYDWLHGKLTQTQRVEVTTAIAEKGCQPLYTALLGMRDPGTVERWDFVPEVAATRTPIDMSRWPQILSKNNFRAVINGGLALGLFAVRDDPRADAWEEMLADGILRFNELIKKDGSYDEAISYINYAMKFQMLAMEVYQRKRGVDTFDTANFVGLIDFVLAMYLPTHGEPHGSVSFGDAGPSLESNTAFWVASKARDGVAQYLGMHHADHYWTSLLYFDPTVIPEAPSGGFELIKTDLDWIIARTGHSVDDMVLAMRSGGPMNHEHADRNALQFKAFGEVLWPDPGKVTYDSASAEWALRTSLGHNMVLIDGHGIQYHQGEEGTNAGLSEARIVRSGMRQDVAFWASDATQGYRLVNPSVEAVTRTVIFCPAVPAVVVADKVVTDAPALVGARWHLHSPDGLGRLAVEAPQQALLMRPAAALHMRVGGTGSPAFAEGALVFEESAKRYAYVEGQLEAATSSVFLITVAVPVRTGESTPESFIKSVGVNRWEVEIRAAGGRFEVQWLDQGPLPEFEVTFTPAK